MIAARKKELEKREKEIKKDIDSDPNFNEKQKEQDKTRFDSHLEHYENGLDSMVNAKAWRDLDEVSDDEWKKKGLEPKGDKLSSSRPGGIASFAIPAGLTCPKAGSCKNHCFALTGHTAYVKMVRDTHSAALGLSERDDFVEKMNEVIGKKFKDKKLDPQNPYRIHAWGDFYSNQYAKKWLKIIKSNAWNKGVKAVGAADYEKQKAKRLVELKKEIAKKDLPPDLKPEVLVLRKEFKDLKKSSKGDKTKEKRLDALKKELAEKDLSKDEKYDLAVLVKEQRKLKKQEATDREESYAKLANLLDKVTSSRQ